MSRYKVKALYVGGRGKSIYQSGDIVTDKNFNDGEADKLVKSGFLEFIPDDSKDNGTSNKNSKNKKGN